MTLSDHYVLCCFCHHGISAAKAKEEEENQGFDYERNARLSRALPLASVIGQASIKQALLLGAVDNSMGGIAISGKRGTAKSVMARGIHALMPPIEVVTGSYCNSDPDDPRSWEVSGVRVRNQKYL